MKGWIAWRTLLDSSLQYRREGFDVTVPPPDNGADLLLTKGDEVIVVQIKSSARNPWMTNRPYPDTSRFDVANKAVHVYVVWRTVGGLVQSPDIESRIASAELLASQDRLEAGFLLGFAALEAAALRVASTGATAPKVPALGENAILLRDSGLIDENVFEGFIHRSETRNNLVHGAFYNQHVTLEDVDFVTRTAKELILSKPSQAAGLLDRILDSPESIAAVGVSPQNLRERLRSAHPTESPDVVEYADQILETLS